MPPAMPTTADKVAEASIVGKGAGWLILKVVVCGTAALPKGH